MEKERAEGSANVSNYSLQRRNLETYHKKIVHFSFQRLDDLIFPYYSSGNKELAYATPFLRIKWMPTDRISQ